MRKIIKGAVYDTDTATYVGDTNKPNYKCHKHQQLFRKRSGEFFLVDFDCGDLDKVDSAPTSIIPISIDEAKDWCEKHVSAEEYEKVFGECVEDGSRVATTITLTRENYEKLKKFALEARKPVSKYLDEVIEKL